MVQSPTLGSGVWYLWPRGSVLTGFKNIYMWPMTTLISLIGWSVPKAIIKVPFLSLFQGVLFSVSSAAAEKQRNEQWVGIMDTPLDI